MHGVCLCMGIIFAWFSLFRAESFKLSFVAFTWELCLHGFFSPWLFFFFFHVLAWFLFSLAFLFFPHVLAWTREYHGELGLGLGMELELKASKGAVSFL